MVRFWRNSLLPPFAALLVAVVLIYGDTLALEFTAEDYQRITAHAGTLNHSWLGPLRTDTEISPRFRPIQFYTLALQYHLFKTRIWLYRLGELLLLTLLGCLLYGCLIWSFSVRRLPALAGSLVAISHFSRSDIVYQFAAQFYLFADMLMILLILVALGMPEGKWRTLSLVSGFTVALLTISSAVIAFPLLLYCDHAMPGKARASTLRKAAYLAAPAVVLAFVDGIRSGGGVPLAPSLLQVAKNVVVASSHLFFAFKPSGFGSLLEAKPTTGSQILAFLWDHPSVPLMTGISLIFFWLLAHLFYSRDRHARLLILGLLGNTFLFSLYVGITPRYLSFSVVFLSALAAYLYSTSVDARRWRWGLALFTLLMAYNLAILRMEKRQWVDEIHRLEAVRKELQRAPETQSPYVVQGIDAAQEIRKFWKIGEK